MNIPNTPEELIQTMMKLSGKSRSEVEALLCKALGDMQKQATQAKPRKTGKTGKPDNTHEEYSETVYPQYLPARQVHKYFFRFTLKGIKPAIWRKIEVPSNITLRHLGDPWNCINHYQEDFTIADLLVKKAATVTFEYDFGDSWQHDIRLSSIDEYQADEPRRINFLSGKCACPPEDCGGIWGYDELLQVLEKRKAGKRLKSEEKEYLECAGCDADYDPEYLDLEECRRIVERYN